MTHLVAALYVQDRGCYYGLSGVEPWGIPDRDARTYAGPHPVVAHPPCARWGRYANGGPSHYKSGRFRLGDDGGCFAAALQAVRTFGGVLEHPKDSQAWPAHGLQMPPRAGGWGRAGDGLGWVCCVDQGHYGHPAAKATWLYAVGVDLPDLVWGRYQGPLRAQVDRPSRGRDDGAAQRRNRSETGVVLLSARKRAATPIQFRDLLLSIARTKATT